MRHLRAAARLFLITVVTLPGVLVWIVVNIVAFWAPRFLTFVRQRIVRIWAGVMLRIVGARLVVSGKTPNPPFCLVSNHLSYMDVLVLHATSYNTLIAKAEIKNWPFFGALARLFGTLFIDRTAIRDVLRVGNLMQQTVEKGEGVTFFPEGTSSGGADVKHFKSSLLDFPSRAGYPVHYASLWYETFDGYPPASDIICWWRNMTFADHLYNLLTLRGFHARIDFGEVPVIRGDRKELASALRDGVVSIHRTTN